MRVSKWGNSLAVRLPVSVVERLGLKEGDELTVAACRPGAFHLEKAIDEEAERQKREAFIETMKQFEGLAKGDYKFDREEANER